MYANSPTHDSKNDPVNVALAANGVLSVSNKGLVVGPETLDRLTARFERAGSDTDGSGLGLAIVAAIAARIGSQLVPTSPRPGQVSGFEASLSLPNLSREC